MKLTEIAKEHHKDDEQDIIARFQAYIEMCKLDIPDEAIIDICIDGVVLVVDDQVILGMGTGEWASGKISETPMVEKHRRNFQGNNNVLVS